MFASELWTGPSKLVEHRWNGAVLVRVALFERPHGRPALGVMDGETVIDVTDWVGPLGACPLGAFLQRVAEEAPPLHGERVPLADVDLLPPALGSAAILCVGVNYADHARLVAERTGRTQSPLPALFTKTWSALTAQGRPIVRPRVSDCLDFEGELVVVIGEHCRSVPREDALDVVGGYTIGQDGSVRDWQRKPPTPTAGKNFHHSGALGPWMVTADEIPDPAALELTTRLNGEVMQQSSVSELLNDVAALIEHITTFMPLAPGDVIFTGTPAGSFADRGDEKWLVPGDEVSVEITGIGTLTNVVADEEAP